MKRGRIYIVAGAAAAALLGASATLERGGLAAVGKAATDALAAIRDRSPGERTAAQLTKTKADAQSVPERIARALPRTRQAEAKPRVRKPLREEALPAAIAPELTDALGLPPLLAATAPGDFAEGPVPAPVPPIGGGGGLIIPGGGGGGGGGGGTPPTDTIPAVPEPATWLNLILGFAVLGWAVRQRRVKGAVRA